MIRVLLADDQALVRGGFRSILETQPDIDVVGEAENGLEAVELADTTSPDVVLMDIRMPHLDGISATRRILGSPAREHVVEPGGVAVAQDLPKVLILTTFDLDEYVYEALQAGASGFLLKSAPPRELADAIRTVHAGDALLAPQITRRLIEEHLARPRHVPQPAAPWVGRLTPRESEVLTLLARGMSNAEIASTLFLSEPTVKTHVTRVLSKMGVRDRVQAVVLAYESRLVEPGASGATRA